MTAEKHFNQRNFDTAAIYYKNILNDSMSEIQYPAFFQSKCLLRIANAYMSDGNVDSARAYIDRAETFLKENRITDQAQLMESFYIKGHLEYIFCHIDSANAFLHKALDYCETSGNDSLCSLIIKDLGNVEFLQHHYDEALNYYEKALTIEKNRKTPSELTISSLYQNMSIIYAKKFEYSNADRYFKTSLDIKEKLLMHDDLLLINAYINYSLLLTEIGDFNRALEFSNRAEQLVITKFDKNHYLLGHIYLDKSVILEKLGKSHQSIFYTEMAINYYLKSFPNNTQLFSLIYTTTGYAYYNLGEIENALKYFKLALNNKNEPTINIAIIKMIADCYKLMDEKLLANDFYKMSIVELEKQSLCNTPIASLIYSSYGIFINNSENKENAKILLHKSFEIADKNRDNNPNVFSFSINNLADFYLKHKKYEIALNYYQLGLNYYYDGFHDSNSSNNPTNHKLKNYSKNLYYTYQGKALALLCNYLDSSKSVQDLKVCIETCKLAFDFLSYLRVYSGDYYSLYSNPYNEENLITISLNAYYELALASNKKEYLNDIFHIFEKNKATILKTSIQASEAINFSSIPSEYVNKENQLKSLINYYNQKIENLEYYSNSGDSAVILQNKNLRFDAMIKHDSLIHFLEKRYPDYYNLKYENSSVTLERVQSLLDSKSAMISYTLTDTNIFISVVTNDDFIFTRNRIDTYFQNKVIKYYKLIKKGGQKSQIKDLSDYLYSTLISPIENYIITKENLIIIPDNYLHYIPFETLSKRDTTAGDKVSFSSLKYLINDYAISYHYSATLWEKGRITTSGEQNMINQPMSFIGYAPVFNNNKSNSNYPPNSSFDSTLSSTVYTRSRSKIGKEYSKLPFSIREVENISNLFAKTGHTTKIILGNEATEEKFKKTSTNFSIIHIATHAFSNDENPQLSGIVFSKPKDPEELINNINNNIHSTQRKTYKEDNDGILYAGEMYNLGTSANLIVLSACETGIGKIVKGEGMIAMTRGLIYSGAQNIVFTLWKISDEHTHNFMVDFYHEILNGSTYAQALRQAKLKMISNESTAFPKLWSGYMLIGQ